MPKSLYLWSLRASFGRGLYWRREREVTDESATKWLQAFAEDEPGIRFVVSHFTPRIQPS